MAELKNKHVQMTIRAFYGDDAVISENATLAGRLYAVDYDAGLRVAQALADIEAEAIAAVPQPVKALAHLEYGARLLTGMLKRAEANGLLVPEVKAWLEAERARQASPEAQPVNGPTSQR